MACLYRSCNWFGLHNHAGPTTKRGIICGFVFVGGKIADIYDINFDKLFLLRFFKQAKPQRGVKHLREESQKVDFHSKGLFYAANILDYPVFYDYFGSADFFVKVVADCNINRPFKRSLDKFGPDDQVLRFLYFHL